MSIPSEAMAAYKRTAARRWQEKKERSAERRQRALRLAEEAAAFLRADYGVTDVILFGSLVHSHRFTATSDIDLAVHDIPKDRYFEAVARLQDLSPEFKIDLVDLRNCASAFREAIEAKGKLL